MPHFETGNSMEEKQASLDDCNKDNPIVATIGRNTLLELLPYNEIAVRVFDDHQVYTKFNISPVPNLIVILNRNIKPLFLRQLYYLSPLKPEAKEKLNNLYNSMKIKSRVSGVKFKELVLKALKNYTFDGKQYVGCIASRPFLRGFYCSFWALFHYLTVDTARNILLLEKKNEMKYTKNI